MTAGPYNLTALTGKMRVPSGQNGLTNVVEGSGMVGIGIEEVGAEVTGIVVIEIGEEEEVVGSGVIER